MAPQAPDNIGGEPPMVIDHELAFRHPANRAALDYWRDKAGARAMPGRGQIDPVEMRGFLPHIGLADVGAPGSEPPRYRVRVAGSVIEEVFGPVTGRTLEEALPPPIAARWRMIFDATLHGRAPVRATTRVTHDGKLFLTAEVLMAPLSDDGKTVSMVFASVAFWTDGDPP